MKRTKEYGEGRGGDWISKIKSDLSSRWPFASLLKKKRGRLSLLSQQFLKFFAGNAVLLARPSITGRHLHHHHHQHRLDVYLWVTRFKPRAGVTMALPWESERERGRGRLSGGKNAEEKWMWPWASTSTWTVRRVSPRGFSSRRKRERESLYRSMESFDHEDFK